MAEIATLILGADAAGLLKGENAIDSVIATAEKAEARVDAAMGGMSKAMTETGAASTTSAKVIAAAEASKARVAEITAAAIRTAEATESLARNAAAEAAQSAADRVMAAALAKSRAAQAAADAIARAERQAAAEVADAASAYQRLRASLEPAYAAELRLADSAAKVSAALKAQVITEAEAARMTGLLAAETNTVGKAGGFAAGGGMRMLGQQLSQVAQQGAVTGNYLGALAVQLPDMALGFGSVAIAASIVATVALPAIIAAFGGGKSAAERAMEANEAYASSFDLIKSDLTEASALEGEYTAALQSGSQQRIQAIQNEAAIRAKLLELDLLDQGTARVEAAQKMVAASQAVSAALQEQADYQLILNQARATGQDITDQLAAEKNLKEATAELEKQQKLYERQSLEFQLIQAKIDSNNYKLTTTRQMLEDIANGASNIGPALSGAASAAYGLASALSTAMGYAAGIRAAIEGMNFTNIGLDARAAALAAGQTAAAAAAAGTLAEETAKLAPLLGAADGPLRAVARDLLETRKAQLDHNVAVTQYIDSLNTARTASSGAGKAAKAAGNAATDAMKEAEQAAKDYADALNAPVISAVDGISNAWGDFVSHGLKDFKGFTHSILGSFQKMLGDMIAMSLRNKILVSLGMGTAATGGALAADAASGTGWMSALGLGGLGKSFSALGGLVGVGGATAGATAGAGGLVAALPAVGILAGGISLLAGLFKSHPTDSGINGTYSGGDFSGTSYITKKNFFGSRTSTSALDAGTSSGIDKTLDDMRAKVLDLAGTLKIGSSALDGFAASISLNTFGLTADQIASQLQAQLAGIGDSMAAMAMGTGAYAKAGETQLAALTRLAQTLPPVNSILSQLGQQIYAVGLAGADAASQLADAFGGLDAMTAASKSYFDLFFSDAEKLASNTKALEAAFAGLGVTMPVTRDAYRAMVSAQDLSTAAGRSLYAALVSMAGAMDQVLPAASALTQAIAQLVSGTSSKLDDMITSTQTAMQAAEQAASQWYSVAQTLRDYIADLRGAKSDLVTAEAARAYNEARFQMLLAQAMAGSQTAYKDLTGAADSLIKSTTDTASTATEAAIQQARIIADLSKAANVADISGASKDVVAGLLRQQKGVLTDIKDYLAAGGVLDPAHIDALNDKLGDLQSAIADAQSIDYAQVVASLDVTATLISKVKDPALRDLLENAQHEIEGTIAFDATTEGLTPAERWLALHAATVHQRTIALLANTSGLSAQDAALALATGSTVEKTINAILTTTMTPEDRTLALATSDSILRTVNLALGETDPTARALALATSGDIARNVSTTISAADANSLATRLALVASSDVTRTVIAALGAGNPMAENLALALASDLTRTVTAILGTPESSDAVLLGLAQASLLARRVTATLGTPATDSALILALQADADLIRTVKGVDGGISPDMLALALATDSDLTRTVIGGVDLSGLSDDQLAFLNVLTGAAAGTITLGGTFEWDPSTGFQTWLEGATQANIADPLKSLVGPIDALRQELTLLTSEIRVQNAADETARAKAKAISDAQAKLALAADAKNAAYAAAQGAVGNIAAFDAANSGYLSTASGAQTSITLNPDGTLNYNGATGVMGDTAPWRANFWNKGGLEDQAQAAAAAARKADRLLQKARDQITALGGVPAFARGGNHRGGLRVVGEHGPELEATGPARIYSANQTREMIKPDNAELVREIRALQQEMRRLAKQHHEFASKDETLQRRMSKLLESWDADGLLTRTA